MVFCFFNRQDFKSKITSFKACPEPIPIASTISFCTATATITREDDTLSDCSDSTLLPEEVDLKGTLHDLLEKMREAQDDGTKIVKMVCIRRVLNNCLFVAAEIFIERKITANHKDQLFIKPLHIWMQYYPWKILHLIRSFDSFIWSQVIDVLLFVTSWTDKNNLMLHIVKNFWPIWVLSHHLFEIVIRKYLVNTLTIE